MLTPHSRNTYVSIQVIFLELKNMLGFYLCDKMSVEQRHHVSSLLELFGLRLFFVVSIFADVNV